VQPLVEGREPTGRQRKTVGVDFDPIDEDFFAREADLHRVDHVDTFDDLDELPIDDGPRSGWFSKKKRR
jgi:hypothetical protein